MHAGKVYIAPPDFHMLIDEGFLTLSHSAKVCFSRPSADRLFLSAAEHVTSQLIGVILTGGNNDGAVGVKAINGVGGTVIARDQATSYNFITPKKGCSAWRHSMKEVTERAVFGNQLKTNLSTEDLKGNEIGIG